MARRPYQLPTPPSPPSVPDLLVAPELAALSLLDLALDVAASALLAEHMTLIDELHVPGHDGPVVDFARVICQRATSLRHVLARYARAARDAAKPPSEDPTADLPF